MVMHCTCNADNSVRFREEAFFHFHKENNHEPQPSIERLKKTKIKDSHRKNFWAYARIYNKHGLFTEIELPLDDEFCTPDQRGVSALKAYVIKDSHGIVVPTRHPLLFRRVLTGKAQLNFHIKQWAEGMVDGVICIPELQEWYDWLPDWVWVAVKNQHIKIKGGYIEVDCSVPVAEDGIENNWIFCWYYRIILEKRRNIEIARQDQKTMYERALMNHRELL